MAFADIESITVFRSRFARGFLVAINFKRFFLERFLAEVFFFLRELCEVYVGLKS